MGATILNGAHIGKNSIIGAGSVITKDVPDNTLALTRAKQKKVKLNKKKK